MSREDHREHDAELEKLRAMQPEEKKPDWGLFVGIFFGGISVLIPLLQTNGVDVNWLQSLAAYLVIIGVCSWTFLRHGVPDRQRKKSRILGILAILASIGSVGTFATLKQYERDHADNIKAVRVTDVVSREGAANSVYVFQIDVENVSEKDIRGDIACSVTKSSFPIKPFGRIEGDTAKEREFENQVFRDVDKAESAFAGLQDLPAQQTVHAYCSSSWIPNQEELGKLERGEFVLYVAGRVRIPSKTEGAHIDVDFCRTGTEKSGLQNCFAYNAPHVHLPVVKP